MDHEVPNEPLFLLLISCVVVLAILVKIGSRRYAGVPPVVGYIVLGLSLRILDNQFSLVPEEGVWTFELLAQVGVAALLFQVGLKSDLGGLARQLPRAARVWVWDVLCSFGLAFGVAFAVGLGLLPALFVGVALSATSVGVSLAVWEDARRTKTRLGQLLLDLAELDDLSAVLLLLLLLTAAPLIRDGGDAATMARVLSVGVGILLAKLVAFMVTCWLFARHVEERFTRWLARAERPPDGILAVVGVGLGVAAVAGALGFSVAVGALFAGLMFSRDPTAVHEQASFAPIHALFTPFFFVDIGYALDPLVMGDSILLGLLLFVPALLGKVFGAGAPVARGSGWREGLVMGLSMLPRAEIALLVARTGNRLGPWAVSDTVYGAVVCAAGLAAILSPIALHTVMDSWVPKDDA
jgi:Kef-type K+ transport system membrane component KefB